jgi:hypothetical protein
MPGAARRPRGISRRVATVRSSVVRRSRPMMRVVIENGGSDWLTPLTALLAIVVGGLVNWAAERRLAD